MYGAILGDMIEAPYEFDRGHYSIIFCKIKVVNVVYYIL